MLRTIDIEVLLSCAYAVFLVLVAFGLELAARYSHHRSKHGGLAGFRYHRQLDLWECPMGQHLRPVASDGSGRVNRYRAYAHVCNACSIKDLCTSSDQGRELEHNPNSWLESEVKRFPSRNITIDLGSGRFTAYRRDDSTSEANGIACPGRVSGRGGCTRNAPVCSLFYSAEPGTKLRKGT